MAKQNIRYECEVCGKQFLKKNIAEQCESEHYKPTKIKDYKYELYEEKPKYPNSINVELKNENGEVKIITFYRK